MSDEPTSRRERLLLADLFDQVGPDHPTLSGEWTTRDLAAHLVVRERRPDAAAGIMVSPLADYGEKVRVKTAGGDWDELVETVRSGPPVWSPTRVSAVDRAVNTIEFFVHHEDVRRAADGWEPRDLDQRTRDDLRSAIARFAKALTRKLPVGLTLSPTDTTDTAPITARAGEPMVDLSGPVGEIVLYLYGRKDVAGVELDGPAEAVDTVADAAFGI